jgi:hypothetical protein
MKKVAYGLLVTVLLGGVAFAGGFEGDKEVSGKNFGVAQNKGSVASPVQVKSLSYSAAKPAALTGKSAYASPASLKIKPAPLLNATEGDRKLIPAVGNGGLILGGVLLATGVGCAVATAPLWVTATLITGASVLAVGAFFKAGSYLIGSK